MAEAAAVEEAAVVAAEAPLSDKEFVLQWHITHRCNLRCVHCYQDNYTAFQNRQSLLAVLCQFEELIADLHCYGHINITGGEPTLHPDLYWLIEECNQRNISTALLTNGTTLTINDAKRLKRLGILYAQVSLDGCEKVHETIRGKDSFQRAVNGILALKSQNIYTDVSFTVQRNNKGELKKLAELCRQLNVDKLWFDRVVISVQEDVHQLSLNAEEYRKFCQRASSLNKKHLVSCARALQFLSCKQKHIYQCSAGKSLLTLTADGSVMPCRRLPIVVGNIQKDTLKNIYRDNSILQQLRNDKIPSSCNGCEYTEQCRGGAKCIAYAKTGDFTVRDPDCLFNS